MPLLNHQNKEINCKLVYCGAAFCGKTTNLQSIYQSLAPSVRGEFVSLSTTEDRTLFFDFLPMDVAEVKGWKVRLSMFTVPGQVEYNASRKQILNGADGVIFVASSDPQSRAANIEALDNLNENLAAFGTSIGKIPLVMQFNKRDLAGAMSIEVMQQELNTRGLPTFQAIAIDGQGVFATLRGISQLLFKQLSDV